MTSRFGGSITNSTWNKTNRQSNQDGHRLQDRFVLKTAISGGTIPQKAKSLIARYIQLSDRFRDQ
jgi:hypothetical protein